MRRISTQRDGYASAVAVVRRDPATEDPDVAAAVQAIIADVRERGDTALLELGRRFDASQLQSLTISDAEWADSEETVTGEVRDALASAVRGIRRFHEHQRRTSWLTLDGGRMLGQSLRPLERVGVYVPGGRAAYPSSVLMCAIPAAVAGVEDICLCSPASADGMIAGPVLCAARLAGIRAVYKVGGAQAVAAMAFGTTSIAKVDKVVGPGNAYVCAAKRALWGVVDMDMVAGPSEVCVVADESAQPAFIAADMLAQAEHDPDCAALLLTPAADLADRTNEEIERQIECLPRREIVRSALAEHGAIIVTRDLAEALDLANICAPEHLALMVADPMRALADVRNAGAVMLGHYTPQTVGDYMAGPSHTLPTGGSARFWSPLHVDTFVKKTSVISYDLTALHDAEGALVALADAEGFAAHRAAVTVRTRAESALQEDT